MVQSQSMGPVRGRSGLVLASGSTGERDTIQLAMEIERSIRSRRHAPTPVSGSAWRGRLSGHDPGYLPSNMPWPAAQSINQPEFVRTAKKVLELMIMMIVRECGFSAGT
jgi:hypothetical protein